MRLSISAFFFGLLEPCIQPAYCEMCQQPPAVQQGLSLLSKRSVHRMGMGELDATTHVVYASTANGFAGLLSSMLSVVQHLTSPELVKFHIFAPGGDQQRLRQVMECFGSEMSKLHTSSPAVQLHATPIPDSVSAFINLSTGYGPKGWSDRSDLMGPETFVRLFLHDYLPHAQRAIWLDTDTIIRSDIAGLCAMEMQHGLAAAEYPGSLAQYINHNMPRAADHLKSTDLTRMKSFNAGVLVLDLPRLRSSGFTQDINNWMSRIGTNPDADQLILNLATAGNFDVLDSRWNLMNLGLTESVRQLMHWKPIPQETIHSAWLLHWTGTEKPWKAAASGKPNLYADAYTDFDRRGQCAALG